MSEADTRALIGRYFEAFNASDWDGMAACLHEDVVHDINQAGREIGRDKFRWFTAELARHYEEQLADIVIMVAEGGVRAAAEFTVHGIYRTNVEGLPPASGQSYTLPAGIFFEVDEGLITRVTTYYNLTDWIRQVEKE